MVSVFLCGIDKPRKRYILKQLEAVKCFKSVSQVDDARQGILPNSSHVLQDRCIQESIIDEQIRLEEIHSNRGETIISDNTIIDTVVYSNLRSTGLNIDDRRFHPSLAIYKKSLMILLSPLGGYEETNYSAEEHEKAFNEYITIFHKHNIPFLVLDNSDVANCINRITEALKGSIPLETSHLVNYGKKSHPFSEICTNFSFFLPPIEEGRICIQIPTITIFEHKYVQDWSKWEQGQCNRFIARHGSDNLIILSFHINFKSTIIKKMLPKIAVNGENYSFLGCSSSGLKERRCFMWKGSQDEADRIIKANGEFDKMSVSKRMARISLLFSAVNLTSITVKPDDVVEDEDLFSKNGKCFTDGCGGVSKELATLLFDEIRKPSESYLQLPAVYQIRLQGYKGVLALDTSMQGTSIKVRPSMKKFVTTAHDRIGVCGYSRPFTFGHLNRQFIMLLSGLNVPDEVILGKQREHFEMIKNMASEPEYAIKVLQWQNKFEAAQRLIQHTGRQHSADDESMKKVYRCIHSVQSKLVSESEKLRIMIPKSRNIYGVCDSIKALDYGECFLRITDGDIQTPKTIKGLVTVCKNPCYLLGDVRVLRAVDDTDKPELKQLSHLVDCIVFPVRGKRPHPDEIAGSDLDGDMFFVSWDSDLIPPVTKPPYDYPAAKVKPRGPVTFQKTVDYFAVQNETQKQTGQVDRYFREWANAKGVASDECKRLGMLFSRVIDSAKSGEKFNLNELPIPPDEVDVNFVWQVLEENAKKFKNEFRSSVLNNMPGFPEVFDVSDEFVESMMTQETSNIGEFAKFRFAWSYLQSHSDNTEESASTFVRKYGDHVNFAMFSNEQKREAISLGIPVNMITNALSKSRLLIKDDLEEFNMNSPANSWKFYFRADHENLKWEYLLKALTQHEQCLLVVRLPDQVTIAIQFLTRSKSGEGQIVDSGTVSGYLYSSNFRYRKKYILGTDYKLDLTKDILQLYRIEKSQTFICLKSTTGFYKRSSFQVDDQSEYPISVDLTRFDRPKNHPLINKVPIVEIEVFVENRSGSTPYFDTVMTNDFDAIIEIEDPEEEEDGCDDTDMSFLLFNGEVDTQHIETEAQFKMALCGAIKACQPISYASILSRWSQEHNSLPNFVPEITVAMVEKMVLMAVPFHDVLPKPVAEALEYIILMQSFKDASCLFKLAGFLSRLQQDDLAISLIVKDLGDCSIDITLFLDIFSDWQTWWFFCHDTATQSLCNAAQVVSKSNEREDKSSEVCKYVLTMATLHFQDLLLDMKNVQEGMKTGKADLSIPNLKLQSIGDELKLVSFTRSIALDRRPGITQGQYVTITRQADLKRNPCNRSSCCCLAQVISIRTAPLTITVKLLGEATETLKRSLITPRLWKIELVANITTFMRVMGALKKLCELKSTLPSLIEMVVSTNWSPQHSAIIKNIDRGMKLSDTLNSKQKEAVTSALSQTLTLIQGPPGTGKTTVACEIIKQLVMRITDSSKDKVLVVSETNIAVDNIIKKLRGDLPLELLRIGSEEGIDGDVYDLSLEGQLMKLEEVGMKTSYRDEQGITRRKKKLVKKILQDASVVLTTCAGAGDHVLEPYNFKFVLVDEATQTKETTLLCSLVHGAEQLVMIGDQMQLGPTLLQDKDHLVLDGLPELTSLSDTLFHRLYATVPSIMLETQHRMHPELVQFPSEEFYGGKLISGISRESRPPPYFPWPIENKPLCFIDVPHGKEERRGASFCNKHEVVVVQQVLEELFNVPYKEKDLRLCISDVGILTFYQAQAHLLSSEIKPKVEVRSIDSFQGREKEVIIVSTVRSNDKGSLGFTASPNRMNVLLTRAKRGLVVVGDLRTLNCSALWGKWLQATPKLNLNDSRNSEYRVVRKQPQTSKSHSVTKRTKPSHTGNINKHETKEGKDCQQATGRSRNYRAGRNNQRSTNSKSPSSNRRREAATHSARGTGRPEHTKRN